MKWSNKPTEMGWYVFFNKSEEYITGKGQFIFITRMTTNFDNTNVLTRRFEYLKDEWDYEERKKGISEEEGIWYGPIKIERPDQSKF